MKLAKSRLITLSLVGLTACSGLVLASTKSYADNDSATDEVNITVPVACTMTGTIATGQEHIATLQPGTYSGASGSAYENGIGKTTLATFCNDYNGFSIYAIGFTGETEGDNTLVGTSASGGATIPTKVYESTDTTSNWSMKVTKVTDTSAAFNPNNMTITNSFDSWHTVPDDYTKVAEYHASTGSSATDQSLGAKVETTYASYISTTQPADTYTGKVKYVMVHPYNGTAPEIPSVSFDDAYATAGKQKLNGYYKMQDMTGDICGAVTLQDDASETTLIDSRDNKTYTVSKLADGNCWMTQNLDHDIVTTPNYYTNQNTDIGWNSNTNSYDTTSWTASSATSAVTFDVDYQAGISSYDPGNYYWDGISFGDQHVIENGENPHYRIGNYYNWAAALAVNSAYYYDYDSEAGDWDYSDYNNYGQSGYDVNRSICPKGWTLPKMGEDNPTPGSFIYLINQYGWNDAYNELDGYNPHEAPLHFNLARTAESFIDNKEYIGVDGVYWSSESNGVGDGYGVANVLYVDTSELYRDSYSTSQGLSVRCVTR